MERIGRSKPIKGKTGPPAKSSPSIIQIKNWTATEGDNMFTIHYKGEYIHGYCDREEVKVNGERFKSLHAAKCAISRRNGK
jgi:hypothetical protein